MTKKKKGNKTYKFFSQENSDEDRYSHKAQRRKRKNKHNVMYRNEAEDQTLRQYIESDGSKTIIDMSSDGNCLFRSLSDQIYRDHGNNHAEVRSDICDFLEAFEEEFAEFLVLDENESDHDAHTFDHYISEMRKDGEWGGNLELVAAARLYRRNITVFSSSLAAFTIEHNSGEKSAGPDMLISYHDNDHYNSVRDNGISKLPPPTKTCIKQESGDLTNETKGTEIGKSDDNHSQQPGETVELEDDNGNQTNKRSNLSISKKKSCPCGSRLRYKKCCWEKERHAARLRKMKCDLSDETPQAMENDDQSMNSNFRILKI